MNIYLSIALGGALGAVGRYFMASSVAARLGVEFPWGTLAVNIVGSFLLGIFYVLIMESGYMSEQWKYVIIAGFLGAFTTFSAFSLEMVLLLQQGHILVAIAYIVSSVVCCVMALALAAWVTKLLVIS